MNLGRSRSTRTNSSLPGGLEEETVAAISVESSHLMDELSGDGAGPVDTDSQQDLADGSGAGSGSVVFLGSLASEMDEPQRLPSAFERIAIVTDTLVSAYRRGVLTEEQAAERLALLRVQGVPGVEWTVGATSQSWYRRFIGGSWHRAVPSAADAGPDTDRSVTAALDAVAAMAVAVTGEPSPTPQPAVESLVAAPAAADQAPLPNAASLGFEIGAEPDVRLEREPDRESPVPAVPGPELHELPPVPVGRSLSPSVLLPAAAAGTAAGEPVADERDSTAPYAQAAPPAAGATVDEYFDPTLPPWMRGPAPAGASVSGTGSSAVDSGPASTGATGEHSGTGTASTGGPTAATSTTGGATDPKLAEMLAALEARTSGDA